MNKINIRGIGITVSPALETAAKKAASGIMRMHDDGTNIFVKLKVDNKLHHKAEATAICKGNTMRVEKDTEDMYKSINEAFDVLEHKMAKYGDKITKRRSGETIKLSDIHQTEEVNENAEFEISVRKTFAAKPMSPEEACLEMEMLDHNFFVFVNSETENTEVVYKRNDGKYGLIAINKEN